MIGFGFLLFFLIVLSLILFYSILFLAKIGFGFLLFFLIILFILLHDEMITIKRILPPKLSFYRQIPAVTISIHTGNLLEKPLRVRNSLSIPQYEPASNMAATTWISYTVATNDPWVQIAPKTKIHEFEYMVYFPGHISLRFTHSHKAIWPFLRAAYLNGKVSEANHEVLARVIAVAGYGCNGGYVNGKISMNSESVIWLSFVFHIRTCPSLPPVYRDVSSAPVSKCAFCSYRNASPFTDIASCPSSMCHCPSNSHRKEYTNYYSNPSTIIEKYI